MRLQDVLTAKQYTETFLRANGMNSIYLNQLSNQKINQDINQYSNQNVSQSVNQNINQEINQKINQEINQSQNHFGIYVNITTRSISVHSSAYLPYKRILFEPSEHPNVYGLTKNGLWIAMFETITDAYAYAEILAKFLYFSSHENSLVFLANSINFVPYQI